MVRSTLLRQGGRFSPSGDPCPHLFFKACFGMVFLVFMIKFIRETKKALKQAVDHHHTNCFSPLSLESTCRVRALS